MLKNILKRYHLHLPTLYVTLAMIWGMALFGFILFEIIMQIIVVNSDEPECFQMAFVMAFMMYIGSAIFTWGISSYTSFNTAISMGCTRKNYIIMRTLFLLVTNLIGILSVCAIYGLEKLYLNWHWKDIPLETDLSFLMNPILLIIMWIVGTILPFFISALSLRFGKVVSIILYIAWFAGCFGLTRIDECTEASNSQSIIEIFHMIPTYQLCLMLFTICIVLYTVAYKLYKKQSVVA